MTTSAKTLSLISAGARTPVGLNLKATLASVRAGVNAFSRSSYLRTRRQGAPIIVSRLEGLDEPKACQRMNVLCEAAAREACSFWTEGLAQARVAVLFAFPERRPTFSTETARQLAQQIVVGLPVPVAREHCFLQQAGNAGAILQCLKAQELLSSGQADICLIGGVDSLIEIESLHWIEDCGRLRSSENPNGLTPGEAAAFIAVYSSDFAIRHSLQPLCEIVTSAVEQEPNPWYERRATLGQGLSRAMQAVFANVSGITQATRVYCDMNGETWRADEWGYAYLRTAQHHRSPLEVIHPANSWGEIGPASVPLLAAVGASKLKRDGVSGESVVLWSASGTMPLRGASILRKV
jgi:3-oxoacyl-[acyl-carrier-protein] synthase-1